MSETYAYILAYLEKLNERIGNVEKRLESITVLEKTVEGLEKKVDRFNLELKKKWIAMEDRNKSLDIKVTGEEEKIECVDFNVAELSSKVIQYEKERDSFKDDVVYLTPQFMRNNLFFTNVDVVSQEDSKKTEALLRIHLGNQLKIASAVILC
jgi:predicted HTH domain antitoxin